MWTFARGLGPVQALAKPTSVLLNLSGVGGNGQVLFSSNGQIAGNANFTWDNATFGLSIGGATSATTGALRLTNNTYVTSRNSGQTGTQTVVGLDGSNRVQLGNTTSQYLRMAGQVRCDLDAAARLVVPVGSNKFAL